MLIGTASLVTFSKFLSIRQAQGIQAANPCRWRHPLRWPRKSCDKELGLDVSSNCLRKEIEARGEAQQGGLCGCLRADSSPSTANWPRDERPGRPVFGRAAPANYPTFSSRLRYSTRRQVQSRAEPVRCLNVAKHLPERPFSVSHGHRGNPLCPL